jgi:glycine betaine/proline transport system ATP-binding protein
LIRRQLQDEFRTLTKQLGKSAAFITHDLEEAIRIGDRIAIMKDGVIIQTGTAEEIVRNPADDYVAEFVAGISRLHLVKARSIMRPVAEFRAAHPDVSIEALPSATSETDIAELITLSTRKDLDAVAILDDGGPIGIVSPRDLLNGIQGNDQPAAH